MSNGFKATKEKATNKDELVLAKLKAKDKSTITLQDIYDLQLLIFEQLLQKGQTL